MDPECADNYAPAVRPAGSHDGRGAGDHDTTFAFGRPRTSYVSLRDYAWLWLLRARIAEGDPRYADDLAPEPILAPTIPPPGD